MSLGQDASREALQVPAGAGLPQPSAASMVKTMSADPRTTNALLLILVLCVSGYMPESMLTLCGV